jgi:hypothetical protein
MKTIIFIVTMLASQEAVEMKFNDLVEQGVVIPNEDNEYSSIERPTYTIILDDSTAIDYAYKGEVKEWIRTGDFEYNDFLND